MPTATYHFPKGFLWGTATSAHQVEGNNTNNQWWKWEQEGHTEGRSALACDWWGGRWKEASNRSTSCFIHRAWLRPGVAVLVWWSFAGVMLGSVLWS